MKTIGLDIGTTTISGVVLDNQSRSVVQARTIANGSFIDTGKDWERIQVLETLVRELAPANKLNLLIYDGTLLYAHYNARGTLHVREEEDAVTFSTAPLAEGSWQEAPFCRLTAWKEGRLLYEGKEHEHEYIPDEASIRALFMAYAGL